MNLVSVQVWDMGLVHGWWHANPDNVGERFAKYVEEQSRGSYTVAALDCEGPTFRHDLFPRYKADRENTDREAIREQIRIAAEVFKNIGVNTPPPARTLAVEAGASRSMKKIKKTFPSEGPNQPSSRSLCRSSCLGPRHLRMKDSNESSR